MGLMLPEAQKLPEAPRCFQVMTLGSWDPALTEADSEGQQTRVPLPGVPTPSSFGLLLTVGGLLVLPLSEQSLCAWHYARGFTPPPLGGGDLYDTHCPVF